MLQINALASQKAAGQDRADGDPDVSDKEIGLSVEHGIEAAVAGQPCEQALHLSTMMPLIRLDRRGNISRRIGHEGLGPPGQRKIDVTHPDQPDPATGDVGQPSP